MSDDLRWPVLVIETVTHRLWAPGTSSEDAAARLNGRDCIGMRDDARRSGDVIGGGIHAEAPGEYDEVYDAYENVGPKLPDGSFWGPGERAGREWPDPRDREQAGRAIATAAATLSFAPVDNGQRAILNLVGLFGLALVDDAREQVPA